MNVKIFVQEQCPNCPSAKELGSKLENEGIEVNYHDIKSVEGLSEAVFCDVMATPSIIISDDDDNEVHSWKGNVPKLTEIKEKFK